MILELMPKQNQNCISGHLNHTLTEGLAKWPHHVQGISLPNKETNQKKEKTRITIYLAGIINCLILSAALQATLNKICLQTGSQLRT
jgi:hypothetical protein